MTTTSGRTYSIQIPDNVPSYMSDSVQNQCNHALDSAFSLSSDELRNIKDQKIEQELWALREAVAGRKPLSDPWVVWGYRTIAQAYRDAESLAYFRESLSSDDFSHVTSGHTVSPNSFHVYRRDPKSPSGCLLVSSISKDAQGVKEAMQSVRTCAGGERGEMASRAMMRA